MSDKMGGDGGIIKNKIPWKGGARTPEHTRGLNFSATDPNERFSQVIQALQNEQKHLRDDPDSFKEAPHIARAVFEKFASDRTLKAQAGRLNMDSYVVDVAILLQTMEKRNLVESASDVALALAIKYFHEMQRQVRITLGSRAQHPRENWQTYEQEYQTTQTPELEFDFMRRHASHEFREKEYPNRYMLEAIATELSKRLEAEYSKYA